VDLASSTYYAQVKNTNDPKPTSIAIQILKIPGYSLNQDNEPVDETTIKNHLLELIKDNGYPYWQIDLIYGHIHGKSSFSYKYQSLMLSIKPLLTAILALFPELVMP